MGDGFDARFAKTAPCQKCGFVGCGIAPSWGDRKGSHVVTCYQCGYDGPIASGNSAEDAINRWNAMTYSPDQSMKDLHWYNTGAHGSRPL